MLAVMVEMRIGVHALLWSSVSARSMPVIQTFMKVARDTGTPSPSIPAAVPPCVLCCYPPCMAAASPTARLRPCMFSMHAYCIPTMSVLHVYCPPHAPPNACCMRAACLPYACRMHAACVPHGYRRTAACVPDASRLSATSTAHYSLPPAAPSALPLPPISFS